MNERALKDSLASASKVISHYWPMTTFVHHNPIRSLETFPFHKAIEIAHRFIGGRGYLPNEMYRELAKNGRIRSQDIDFALRSFAQNKELEFSGKELTHFDVLRACLLGAYNAPTVKLISRLTNAKDIKLLADRLVDVELNSKTDPFQDSVCLSAWCDQELNTQIVSRVNNELIKWCKAFLDEGDATWPMPEREKGFYAAWKTLASQEWSNFGIKNCAKKIKELPDAPEQAVLEHLTKLAVPQELMQDFLSLQLTALYGWASFINWRAENSDYQWQVAYPIDLMQYLAVRLFYEREYVDQTCKSELQISGNFDEIRSYIKNKSSKNTLDKESSSLVAAWKLTQLGQAFDISPEKLAKASSDQLQELLMWINDFSELKQSILWLEAYESRYKEELVEKLELASSKMKLDANSKERPLAQLIFCIDVRSEPFRRNLEAIGNYETLGFAGFFGIAIKSCALDQHHETDQCPAILKPAYRVHEVVREGQHQCNAKHTFGKNLLKTLQEVFSDLKYQVLSPYIMVEALGWLFGLQLLEKTLFPGIYKRWRAWVLDFIVPKLSTKMTADYDEQGRGLTKDQQNTSVEGILRTMGLTDNFARLVVITGHSSQSDNNPYEAALNCGACGGNSGEPNARLLASIVNKPELRSHLAEKGIVIPDDTHFLAAVHNTTTDLVEFYDLEDLPKTHIEDLKKLKQDLQRAKVQTNLERCLKLPGTREGLSSALAVKEVERRSADWSETRPEWGLSGNASFIIGRRALTKELNLAGRAFLNSHDYRLDPTGALLEGILMGPMVVGQWINAEHYFSATDPEVYGSGSKIYHNVVGRLGIMSGPQSDLRTGLAWQSVASGDMTYHEPLRLFVVVEAPRQRILEIVERQPILKQLCDNEWIHLLAIDYETDEKLYCYQSNQGWMKLEKLSQVPF